MPIYVFRCDGCGAEHEALLRLGATEGRRCPDCGQPCRLRPARVAVRYEAFGFTTTDRLIADPRGRDFGALRERAEQIADE